MPDSADQKVAEHIFGAIDGRIVRLQQRREVLLNAAAEIAEIDAELAVLQAERTRIDQRRVRKDVAVDSGPSVRSQAT
jgi:5-carboxymethyl-2-hydroxymuconate isomerase